VTFYDAYVAICDAYGVNKRRKEMIMVDNDLPISTCLRVTQVGGGGLFTAAGPQTKD